MASRIHLNFISSLGLALLLAGCSWVDSTGKQTNQTPQIQLDQPLRTYTEGDIARVPVSDDDPVAVRFTLTGTGPTVAGACSDNFLPAESAETIEQACVGYLDAEQCKIEFTQDPDSDTDYIARIPALSRPIAQRYLIEAQDQSGAVDERELDLCLVAVNTAPIARPDPQYQVVYNETVEIADQRYDEACGTVSGDGVLNNDDDDFDAASASNDGPDCLEAELVEAPYPGFSLNRLGGFMFRSDGTVGPGDTYTFTYRATDGELTSSDTTVTVLVTGENNPPSLPARIEVDGRENTTIEIDIVGRATDESDALTVRDVTDPANGTVTSTPEGIVRYEPSTNFFGQDTFSVTIADPGGKTATTLVQITVKEVNDAPVITGPGSQTYSYTGNPITVGPRSVTVQLSDQETPVEQLRASVSSSDSSVATAQVSSAIDSSGRLVIPIQPLRDGTTTITLRVTDLAPSSGLAAVTTESVFTVRVNGINASPTARDDQASVTAGQSVTVDVLTNDSDTNGDALEIARIVSGPSLGSARVSGNRIVYSAPASQSGTATLVYEMTDGRGQVDSATLRIEVVLPENQPPTAGNTALTLDSGAQGTVDLGNLAADPEGGQLTYAVVADGGLISVSVNAAGVMTIVAPSFATTTTRTVVYSVTDDRSATVNGNITVTVSAAPNQPPTATNDALTLESGQSGTVELADNVSDPENGNLTFSVVSAGGMDSVTINGSGRMTVRAPTVTSTLTANVVYRVTDSANASATATVVVTVNPPANQPPTATNDALTLGSGQSGRVELADNVNDPENGDLTFSVVSAGGMDSVTINGSGRMTVRAPTVTSTLTANVVYRVTDSANASATATVVVTVNPPPNQPPTATNDALTLESGQSGTVELADNVSDPENGNLTFSVVSLGGMDSVTINGSGSMTVDAPTVTQLTQANVVYRVTDDQNASATATVVVTVNPPPVQAPAPVPANDTQTLDNGEQGTVDLSENVNDPETGS